MSDSSFDAFMPDVRTGYSPEKWYTRSTNGKGFDKSVKVISVPPEVLGAIDALIQSGQVPINTKADAFRDALVHWLNLRHWQLKNGIFDKAAMGYIRLAEAERQASIGKVARDTLAVREDSLRAENDPEIRAQILEGCRGDIEAMPTEGYRQKMRDLIERYSR